MLKSPSLEEICANFAHIPLVRSGYITPLDAKVLGNVVPVWEAASHGQHHTKEGTQVFLVARCLCPPYIVN